MDLRICCALLYVSLISVIPEKDIPTIIPDIQAKVLKKVVEVVDKRYTILYSEAEKYHTTPLSEKTTSLQTPQERIITDYRAFQHAKGLPEDSLLAKGLCEWGYHSLCPPALLRLRKHTGGSIKSR